MRCRASGDASGAMPCVWKCFRKLSVMLPHRFRKAFELAPWPFVLHVRRRSTSQYSVVHPAARLHELLPGVLPGEHVKHALSKAHPRPGASI